VSIQTGRRATVILGRGETLILGRSFKVVKQVGQQAPLVVGAPTTVGPRGPQGQQGPPGPAASPAVTVEAATDLNAYTVVRVGTDGKAHPSSSLTHSDGEAATGITTVAARAGEQIPIRTAGALTTTAALPVGPLYLDTDGALTGDPDTGLFQLRVGYAQTPTLLVIRIEPPIYF
jgi:hypothetical protein